MPINRVVVFIFRGRHSERLDLLAIQQQFQLMRLVQALHLFIAITGKPDLDFVFRILRKSVVNQHPAAGPEWQSLNMLLLSEVWGRAERVATRSARRANGEAADLLRR